MGIIISIFAIILAIVIQIVLANVFANIAEDKGHSKTAYFWTCLLLGTIGYMMVAALPDLNLQAEVEYLRDEFSKFTRNNACAQESVTQNVVTKKNEPKKVVVNTSVLEDGVWICNACGRRNTKGSTACWNCKTTR